jgi:hypothetical protein
MTKQIIALSLFSLVGACVDLDDSTDTADDSTSSVTQAINELNNCATGTQNNGSAFVSYTGTELTRSAFNINQTCDCIEWQLDKAKFSAAHANQAFPKCRPGTLVIWTVNGEQLGYVAGMELSPADWHLTNGQTECENSTAVLEIEDAQHNTIWQPPPVHGTWGGTGCNGINIASPQGIVMSGTYYVKGHIERGLPEFGHGYETAKLYVNPY